MISSSSERCWHSFTTVARTKATGKIPSRAGVFAINGLCVITALLLFNFMPYRPGDRYLIGRHATSSPAAVRCRRTSHHFGWITSDEDFRKPVLHETGSFAIFSIEGDSAVSVTQCGVTVPWRCRPSLEGCFSAERRGAVDRCSACIIRHRPMPKIRSTRHRDFSSWRSGSSANGRMTITTRWRSPSSERGLT